LSRAQLGRLLGVGQARIARIEQDPAAVSFEQFLSIVSALGAHAVLRSIDARPADRPAVKAPGKPTDELW
jgi:HTH-type transcriptional regulator/antitoxin HipB